jgi:hypothetical protein
VYRKKQQQLNKSKTANYCELYHLNVSIIVDVAGQVLLTPFLISWREDKCGPARNDLKVTRGSWPTSAVD